MYFDTIKKTVANMVINLSRPQKTLTLLAVDVVMIPVSYWVTMLLFGAGLGWALRTEPFAIVTLIAVMGAAGAAISAWLGLPKVKLNAYEQSAILKTAVFSLFVGVTGYVAQMVLVSQDLPLQSFIIFMMVLLILSVATRITMRAVLVALYRQGRARKRVLIYGAGQTGAQLATALGTDDAVLPVAFVDDNVSLQGVLVAGLKVHSPVRVEQLIKEQEIDRVVIAMPSISRPKQARIARRLTETGCEVSLLPSFAALLGDGNLMDRVQPANAAEYLNRASLEAELSGLNDIYADKTVMITGAGGSIGSELVRQMLTCRPKCIVLFEVSEFALYQLNRELEELGVTKQTEIVSVLGSVIDSALVGAVLIDNAVDIVLHAAAYKHVNIVEINELAGLRNNVMGTKALAEAARDAQVSHFILVSTDKAVRPTSMMGASKRLAELFVQDLASRTDNTAFAIVRFGNVLGSSGSVVPLFEEQIARGGPVTLTHKDVTRYFMTLSEAARLVLSAGNATTGNDMFVLNMGDPVPIRHLAEQMIEAAGYKVATSDTDDIEGIEIRIDGLKPGEKLHEELVSPDATLTETNHPKIRHASEPGLSELETARAMQELQNALETGDTQAARDAINRWVGRYTFDETTQDLIKIS